jgi:hypothetical protein
VVVSFDYRYFATGDGQPRQLVHCFGRVEDCRNALTFAETLHEFDSDKLASWECLDRRACDHDFGDGLAGEGN